MSLRKRKIADTEFEELPQSPVPKPQRVSVSPHGMVSSQHYLATEAGVRTLAAGGNAIDAAVAASFALGVCEPAASGLGGQTFLIIHLAKTRKTFIMDGSSSAPHRAIPGTLSKTDRRRGYKAATVPTTPRVLGYTLRKYGSLPLPHVLEPAIELAESGYEITELQHALLKRELRHLRKGTAGAFFLKDHRRTYRVGERFCQPVLAETLRQLARRGIKDFYTGYLARKIHRDMVRHGGLIQLDDLAQVGPPLERKPVACWFDGMRVMTMPPPGAGRTLIEMLNIIASLPKKYRRIDEPQGALMLARIMRQAYRDRRDRPYDPNYYAQISDRRMISPDFAKKMAKKIRTGGETTHASIMDRWGNVVGLTQSIERVYGSCCAGEDLGFLYNNYMMAFETDDYSHPYYLRPNAVPWASVAPTIVFRGRKPWLVIGSPGSERITASIFQVLLRLSHQHPFAAVDAPRLYCSLDRRVSLEASRMRDDIQTILIKNSFTIDRRPPYSFYLGCVQLVMREEDNFTGVADPRRDGAAAGPKV